MHDDTESLSTSGQIVWHLLVPAAIGGVTGACVAGLVAGVEGWTLDRLGAMPGMLPALFGPLALLLTYLASRYITRVEKPTTSELYITLYHEPDSQVPREQLPGRLLATTATVGLGGSQGFESTSALVGVTWSDAVTRGARKRVSESTRRSLLAAGASAGIAAVFSSPGAGALYGVEVPYKRDLDAPRLIPCVVAAVCSYAMRCWLIGEVRIIEVSGLPVINLMFVIGLLMTAITCGLGAKLFAGVEEVLRGIGRRQSRITRALISGMLLSLLAVAGFTLCGRWITFGSGYIATSWLQAEPRAVNLLALALLIRAGGNLVTVYGGGGGGVFTSLACNGAFIGEVVAILLGCDTTHTLALVGAACFLGAGYRLPLACMLFLAEAGLGIVPTGLGILAVGIATVCMGDNSDAQTDHRKT